MAFLPESQRVSSLTVFLLFLLTAVFAAVVVAFVPSASELHECGHGYEHVHEHDE
jgi:hypothetical protein